METKFQTSFIPKKPLLPQEGIRTHSSTSIIMVIGVLLFIASIALAGLSLVYKSHLLKVQEKEKVDLADNEKRFNLPLIEELKRTNLKIDMAGKLLRNHIAVSEALTIVAGLTAERVHFSSFEFTAPDASTGFGIAASQSSNTGLPGSPLPPPGKKDNTFKIRMKGLTDTFNSVAFQSDVFGDSAKYGTNKALKNPVLSDLVVDANGNVSFNFSADVLASDVSYSRSVSEMTPDANPGNQNETAPGDVPQTRFNPQNRQ